MHSIVAVVVNWQQPERTIQAVRALQKQTHPLTIVIVDNGSGDDSVAHLKRALPEVPLLTRENNGGFGAGCNLGIRWAIERKMSHVWLINNDAMVDPICLERLTRRLDQDPGVGVVGAIIRDPEGRVPDHVGSALNSLSLGSRYISGQTELDRMPNAWVAAACALISVDALARCGSFDERYFMYWEDADLCSRFRAVGFRLVVADDAIAWHSAGTSSDHMRVQRFHWHLMSQLRWVSKNFPFKPYGTAVVIARHLLKSVVSRDLARLRMTFETLWNMRRGGG